MKVSPAASVPSMVFMILTVSSVRPFENNLTVYFVKSTVAPVGLYNSTTLLVPGPSIYSEKNKSGSPTGVGSEEGISLEDGVVEVGVSDEVTTDEGIADDGASDVGVDEDGTSELLWHPDKNSVNNNALPNVIF